MNPSTPSLPPPITQVPPNLEWLLPRDFPLPSMQDLSGPIGVFGWLGRLWDWFWFARTDPLPLGAVRIFTGLMLLYIHLIYSNQLLNLFGPDSWIDHKTITEQRHTTPFAPPPTEWGVESEYTAEDPLARGYDIFSVWFHVTEPRWIITLHLLFLLAMLLFTVGFQTRVTGVIAWIGMISYIQRAPTSLFGMDTIMNVLMIYLIIGSSGATLSVDRWLTTWWARRRSLPAPPVEPSIAANFALRLMQIHICIVYLASGCSKLQGAAWWNGTATWYTMVNYEFTPMNWGVYEDVMVWLCQHRWLWESVCAFGCLFTIVLEIGFIFLVWWRPTRWTMIGGAVILHVGIGMIMGLTTFSLFMMCLLLSFVPAESIHSLLAYIRLPSLGAKSTLRTVPAVASPPEAMVAKG